MTSLGTFRDKEWAEKVSKTSVGGLANGAGPFFTIFAAVGNFDLIFFSETAAKVNFPTYS